MRRFSTIILLVVILLVAGIGQSLFAGQWKFESNANGQPVSASTEITNSIGLELKLKIDLDVQPVPSPTQGMVKFQGGFERPLGLEEMMFYWKNYKGDRELWEFKGTQGKIYSLKADKLPQTFQGAVSRVFLVSCVDFIGRVATIGADQITLDVSKKDPLKIEVSQIREFQFMR
jgi:hypothetical protein